jgi:RimJ/RimL family protein N-acetyltransferase
MWYHTIRKNQEDKAMTIRLATEKDTIRIIRAIQNKHMDYNTTADVRADVAAGRLFVAEENGKLLGSMAVFYKPHRGYYAITRGCVYSKKSRGKGVASALVDYILSLGLGTYGATPWNDNPAMCHIFEKRGFEYQYTFKENYKFYKKSA